VNPSDFQPHHEFAHVRTVVDAMQTGDLFQRNPLLPVTAYYPGLSLVTNALVRLSGLPAVIALLLGVALIATLAGVPRLPPALENATPEWWPGAVVIVLALAVGWAGRRYAKPVALLAILGVGVLALLQVALVRPIYGAYDMRPMGLAIRAAQDAGRPVIHFGLHYHNQFQFAGRLQKPLLLRPDEMSFKALRAEPPCKPANRRGNFISSSRRTRTISLMALPRSS